MFYTLSEKTLVKYSEADAVNHSKIIARNSNKIERKSFGENASLEKTLTLPELNEHIQMYLNQNFTYAPRSY